MKWIGLSFILCTTSSVESAIQPLANSKKQSQTLASEAPPDFLYQAVDLLDGVLILQRKSLLSKIPDINTTRKRQFFQGTPQKRILSSAKRGLYRRLNGLGHSDYIYRTYRPVVGRNLDKMKPKDTWLIIYNKREKIVATMNWQGFFNY